jgi:uncharacterized protein YwbE
MITVGLKKLAKILTNAQSSPGGVRKKLTRGMVAAGVAEMVTVVVMG